jgi:hypothetical protein
MKRKVSTKDWEALKSRRPIRWCPDPHQRGRAVPSKKLYQRKPRTPSGVYCFGQGIAKASSSFQQRAASSSL